MDDDDDGATSSSFSSGGKDEAVLVGFVIANIVGLRYHTGTVSGREMVGFVREPLNPHDPNAIKVLNTRSAQVGYVERAAAAALAPLLDSCIAFCEAIVPKPPTKNRMNSYRLPCQVYIFSRPDAVPFVREAVSHGGLHLIEHRDHEFGLSQAAIVRDLQGSKKPKSEKGKCSLDELFALVGKGGEGKIAPLEPPKGIISTELLEHQKEGLGWLVSRENSSDLPPFWEHHGGVYINILTNYETSERPEPLKGGIFADDMGLGKTLTLLSLIATNGPYGSMSTSCVDKKEEEEEEDGNLASGGKKLAPVKEVVNSCKKRKLEHRRTDNNNESGPKTTLIVCPPSVITSWISQLEDHTVRGSLKTYLFHGQRTRVIKELLKYDIVITTYNTLSVEFSEPLSPIKGIEWWRVILDEAHLIKNFASQQTKAVISLNAKRKWVVTGTPIQNSSSDLFSLMAFLRFQPFSIKSYWQSLVQRPLDQGKKSGLERLQALIGTISLRRTKEVQNGSVSLVGLLPKTVEICFVELSAEERDHYDRLESEAQNTVNEYIDTDTILGNYSTVLHIILRLRQICNDMALCPSDIKSLLPSNALEDVSQNPELLKKFASLVEDGDDFDCPVCLSPPVKTLITSCTHIFCQTCLLKTLKNLNARCPLCRHPLSKTDLFVVPPTESSKDETDNLGKSKQFSSKVSKLVELLSASRNENPSTKSVVFSQFRKMLILLEEPLRDAGFVTLRFDGTMNTKKRSEVIKEFANRDPDAPTVLLASLKAAGTGINLTAASRVYLMEPWWNPAVEEQAMDRVHRIGQQEEVKVVRLIVKSSIEERILKLQEKKKQMALGAFGRKGAKEQKQMRIEDIRMMMHL